MRLRTVTLLSSLFCLWGFMAAQPNRSGQRPGQERFEHAAPAVGDSLPQLQVYDEKGEPFQLESLKGRFSVLVFGCLT